MGTGNVKGRSLAVAESDGLDLKPARDLKGELSAHRKALADLMRSQAADAAMYAAKQAGRNVVRV